MDVSKNIILLPETMKFDHNDPNSIKSEQVELLKKFIDQKQNVILFTKKAEDINPTYCLLSHKGLRGITVKQDPAERVKHVRPENVEDFYNPYNYDLRQDGLVSEETVIFTDTVEKADHILKEYTVKDGTIETGETQKVNFFCVKKLFCS